MGSDRDAAASTSSCSTRRHALVVFRPANARHRVIDTDADEDVTAGYAPDQRIDLGHIGVDAPRAPELLRVGANQLERGSGTDDDRLARHLAALDQSDLWTAAERLAVAEARRNAAVVTATGAGGPPEEAASKAKAATDAAQALQLVAEAAGPLGSCWRRRTGAY